MSSNATKESAASPQFNISHKRPADVVNQTVKRVETMKLHPEFATTPGMPELAAAWVLSAQAIDKASQDAISARAQLQAAVAARSKASLAWARTTKSVLARIGELTAGSPAAVTSWGFDVQKRTRLTPSNEAPTGLEARYTKELALYLVWTSVPGNVGYMLQMGDGSPEGWGASIPCTKARYVPTGLTPGQHLSARVQVQRRNGVSAWSDVLSIIVR